MFKEVSKFQKKIQYEKVKARPYMQKRRYLYYEMIMIGLITSAILVILDEYSGTFSNKVSLLTIAIIATAWLYRHELIKSKGR